MSQNCLSSFHCTLASKKKTCTSSIRISTMLKALVLLLFVVLASASPTQWLGQPGLPWTEEEILAVKAKLVKIFLQKSLVYKEYMKLHPEKEDLAWSGKLLPNAAKLLRLGFHDCLTTEGGGGGCNGCLNPTGMRKNTLPPSDEVKAGGKHPSVDHNCDFISAFGI